MVTFPQLQLCQYVRRVKYVCIGAMQRSMSRLAAVVGEEHATYILRLNRQLRLTTDAIVAVRSLELGPVTEKDLWEACSKTLPSRCLPKPA
jgi:hypothetical protein